MRKFFALIGIIALVAAAPAADAPKSLDARTAQARYDKAARDAELAYKNAMISACRTLIDDLTAARDKVLKNGAAGLDEANRINASIETAKADLRRLLGIAQTFTIFAKPSWQQTLEVKKGDRITVTAEGKWCYWKSAGANGWVGPDGKVQDGSLNFYLEGRIGDGMAFKIGSRFDFVADADGFLQMRMNENSPDQRRRLDNDGSLQVSIVK